MQPIAHNDNVVRQGLGRVSKALPDRAALLQSLRGEIDRLEGHEAETVLPAVSVPQGVASFAVGKVHELWARHLMDHAACMAMLLQAVAETEKPVLWVMDQMMIRDYGLPYGPGLLSFGVDPARIMLVRARKNKEVVWALEEGLKVSAFAAIVGEVQQTDLTTSRRLSLMAREHKSLCLLLVRNQQAPSSAAYSRWQIRPYESRKDEYETATPGVPQAEAQLMKHRGGEKPYRHILPLQKTEEPDHAAYPVPMVASVAG